jgi:hypothetical protein
MPFRLGYAARGARSEVAVPGDDAPVRYFEMVAAAAGPAYT